MKANFDPLRVRVSDLERTVEAMDALRIRLAELEQERELIELRGRQMDDTVRERDDYIAAFESLAGVEDELVAVRRSSSYRLGNAMLAPLVAGRRVLRAWIRAKR